MKKLRWVIIGLICIILVCSVVFYWPKPIQKTVICCDLSGNTVQVELNLKYCRRLFSCPHLKGSVFVDGVEYVDQDIAFKTISNANHSFSNWVFYQPTTDYLDLLYNSVLLMDLDGTDLFDKFLILRSEGDGSSSTNGTTYYGPAQTAEEAQALRQLD